MASFSLFSLLAMLSSSALGVAALPTVSFRLDDVQAWWCEKIVKNIVDEFLSLGVPLNLGLIGDGGSALSDGGNIGTYLAGWASNPLVEMTSHSHTHVSYSSNTLAWQKNDLKDGNDEMELVTGIRPTTFIPPLNEFNADTVTAMITESMDIMSPSCMWDTGGVPIYCPTGANVVAPNIDYNGVDMLPAGAVLGDEGYWTNFSRPANTALAIEWIERQIENQGFSVVMLHPVEFATNNDCNVLNDKFTQLREVIAYGAGKWDFKTYSAQRTAVKGGSVATETPTSFPTAAPTPVPSSSPTTVPSSSPTTSPTSVPTLTPTMAPTRANVTPNPTNSPTLAPTPNPVDSTNCSSSPLSVNTVTTTSGDTSTTVTTVTSDTQQIITTTVTTTTTQVVAISTDTLSTMSSGSTDKPSALYLALVVVGGVFVLLAMLLVGRKVGMNAAQERDSSFSVSTENTRGQSLYGEYVEGQDKFKKENPLESTSDNRNRVRRMSSSSMVAMGALTRAPSTKYEDLGSAI